MSKDSWMPKDMEAWQRQLKEAGLTYRMAVEEYHQSETIPAINAAHASVLAARQGLIMAALGHLPETSAPDVDA